MASRQRPIEARSLSSRLDAYSAAHKVSRSDVVKAALTRYLEDEERQPDALVLGEGYFGKFASGAGDLSSTYKTRLKQKLATRHRGQEGKA